MKLLRGFGDGLGIKLFLAPTAPLSPWLAPRGEGDSTCRDALSSPPSSPAACAALAAAAESGTPLPPEPLTILEAGAGMRETEEPTAFLGIPDDLRGKRLEVVASSTAAAAEFTAAAAAAAFSRRASMPLSPNDARRSSSRPAHRFPGVCWGGAASTAARTPAISRPMVLPLAFLPSSPPKPLSKLSSLPPPTLAPPTLLADCRRVRGCGGDRELGTVRDSSSSCCCFCFCCCNLKRSDEADTAGDRGEGILPVTGLDAPPSPARVNPMLALPTGGDIKLLLILGVERGERRLPGGFPKTLGDTLAKDGDARPDSPAGEGQP